MLGTRRTKVVGWMLTALGLCLMAPISGQAERLPIKIYTTADGLANNTVNRVVRDSRGFLWFCTREGLSRFDGYSFTNYGIEQGLPSAIVNDLLETREGVYWVATAGGLCRFNPLGKRQASINNASETDASAMFALYFPGEDARSKDVLSLLQDRAGSIWCGTRNGLYRVGAAGEVNIAPVDLGIPDHFESRFIECLLEDRLGALWVGSHAGLYRRWPDGRIETYTTREGLPDKIINSLLEDREGSIWVGTRLGWLCRLVPDPALGRTVVMRAYSDKDGLPTWWINQLFQASDGRLWAGSGRGLVQFIPTADGRDFRFRSYERAHGFGSPEVASVAVASLAEDRNGNLWVATLGAGAAKIMRSGFTTFGNADGFSWATSILETRAGELVVVGAPSAEGWSINRFDGEKFIPTRLQVHPDVLGTWGWNQTLLEDHTGEWWVATRFGVFRFPKVSRPDQLAHTPPKAMYTTRDGLAADVILRLFEDSRGDIWIGSVGEGKGPGGLSRWERSTGAFYHYTEKNNLPRLDTFYVSSFAEDRAGALWIGFSGDGGLVRYRDGGFTSFTSSDGVPSGQIRNMLIDSAGRLWLTTYRGGLSRIDDTAADSPTFFTYTAANGLSSNEVTAVTEDRWGRIYIGTGRGIDRLDSATGHVRHFTTADGLSLSQMQAAVSDRQGALWFSSFATGLVRLIPEPDPPPVPPPILITGLRIAGEAHPISSLGEVEIAPIELGANKNQLQIEFVALGFSPGEGLRYQYRLEGASEDWSQLSDQRTINFANLAPGRYRFLVRAVNADGVMSERPATFSFRILPPIWQRWWFVTIVVALAGIIAHSLYRYRVAQLLELERVRTRIAGDLHDDIGANLTKIAILSEVAHQQLGLHNRPGDSTLSSIADISRESVASMRDIVWAINPKRDRLRDLTRRMRGFASDIFTSRDIDFKFQAPDGDREVKLNPEMRRDVFLIFKEAVNNIVRHSECSKATIDLRVEGGWLVLSVSDDGKGVDAAAAEEGQGLSSMRRRSESFGGTLEIVSPNGGGTTVRLKVPIGRGR